MPNCPHCKEEISKLSGFVPESTLTERLAGKQSSHDKAIESLEGKLGKAIEAKKSAELKLSEVSDVDVQKLEKRYAKAVERADQLEQAFSAYKTESETALVWAQSGIDDEDTRDFVLHRWGRLDEADRPTLADYLSGPAREDKLLAPLLGGAPDSDAPAGSDATDDKTRGGGAFSTFNPNAGVAGQQKRQSGASLKDLSGMSYDQKVKVLGSHEALEAKYGFPVARPKSGTA